MGFSDNGETVDVIDDRITATEREDEPDDDTPKYQDKEWLHHQYHVLMKSQSDIANECGVSKSTIVRWMDTHDIDARESGVAYSMAMEKNALWRKRDWLYDQYVNREKSTVQIAEEQDAHSSTIRLWLKKHDIETRSSGSRSPRFYEGKLYANKDWLRKQYVDKQRPKQDIADECGVSYSIIHYHLKKFDIEIRSKSEALSLYVEAQKAIPKTESPNEESEQSERTTTTSGLNSYQGPSTGINATGSHISTRRTKGTWVPYRDPEWLEEQYWDMGKSTVELAEEAGCSEHTIWRWMDKHGIERRPPGVTNQHTDSWAPYHDPEWLEEQYWDKGKTSSEMAEEAGCSPTTICRWMDKLGIETRSPGPTNQHTDSWIPYRDPEWLEEQYWDKDKSLYEMAEEAGCSGGTIRNWMDRHDIETRPPGTNQNTES